MAGTADHVLPDCVGAKRDHSCEGHGGDQGAHRIWASLQRCSACRRLLCPKRLW